jgi:hypothetical protein
MDLARRTFPKCAYTVIYLPLQEESWIKCGGPIQVPSLRSTRLESGLLTSAEWLLLDQENSKRR